MIGRRADRRRAVNKPPSGDDRESCWGSGKKKKKEKKTTTKHRSQYAFGAAGPRVQLFVLLAPESSRQMVWPWGLIHYRLDYQPRLKSLEEAGRVRRNLEEPGRTRKSQEGP